MAFRHRKVGLIHFGCKLNYAETSTIRRQLEQYGFEIVSSDETPDYVIINSCAVTDQAERDCRKAIRRIHRRFPEAKIVVTGCYAQLRAEELATQEGVIAVFGNTEKFQIAPFLLQHGADCTPQLFVRDPISSPFQAAWTSPSDQRTRAFLKIQDGCDYKCSYCTIPKARGRSRGMPLDEVIDQLRRLEEAGYTEVVLTGINLGDYRYHQYRFVDVLQAIERQQPKLRIRISSIEPNLLTEPIIEILAQSSVFCPHIHLPLQSGAPMILRAMRRRYTVERYRHTVERLVAAIPTCAIGVDVIVGFPGETAEQFEQTYQLLDDLPIAYLHVFSFSPRSGTDAARMTDHVDERTKRERSIRLRQLSDRKRGAFARRFVQQQRDWIPEQYDSERSVWIGWTDNYIRVEVAASPTLPAGRYSVMIEQCNATGQCRGRLLSTVNGHLHAVSMSLPVLEDNGGCN